MAGRPPMKWWGWGSPDIQVSPSPRFVRRLIEVLGPRPSVLAPRVLPRLTPARPVSLPCRSANDEETRLIYSGGRSYLDLIRLRSGGTVESVDAVAFPESAADIAAVLALKNVAVIPFGGGTSVVGGVAPLRGDHDTVVALDMSRLCRIINVDKTSMTVTAEAGVFGPQLEAAVQRHGLTLGHYPQSFEYSTLGGWIATRSAGQESTRYGRIENMVARVSAITPAGRIDAGKTPASATGPEVRELLVGSEGTFGVIAEATMRLHPVAQARQYRSYLFPGLADGIEACRELIQSSIRPAVMRLSDETETQISFDLAGTPELIQRAFRFTGRRPGAHLLLAFDGGEASAARPILRKLHGMPLGSSPGRHWERERFRHPYLRDTLLDLGYMLDTFETAAPWSDIHTLYDVLKKTAPGIVACHLSHAYPDGASLYFTVIDNARPGQEAEQWHAFKSLVTDTILKHGGTLSHHHAIGVDHKRWLAVERGELAVSLLRTVKRELDPFGIMNPGKLL
ncbi:MAG: FAD-binding oxidoreductase [Thermoanaerobaculia bacterium]